MDPWTALTAIVALAAVYVLLPVTGEVFFRLRRRRRLNCPETGAKVEMGVDARWAAFTAAFGQPRLRVRSCSLWPERSACGQSCLSLSEKEQPEPLRPPLSS